MVGTAVYQVGWTSLIQEKNLSALKPVEQHTWHPAESGANVAAMRPWMWKSGMMFTLRSAVVRRSVLRTLRAEAHTLRWVSGTILGREVVPEVWSTRAMSSAAEGPLEWAGEPLRAAEKSRRKRPAPSSGVAASRTTGMPSLLAMSMAGEVLSFSMIRSLARRSVM